MLSIFMLIILIVNVIVLSIVILGVVAPSETLLERDKLFVQSTTTINYCKGDLRLVQ